MKIEYQVDEFIEYCVEKGLSRSKNDIKQELKYFRKVVLSKEKDLLSIKDKKNKLILQGRKAKSRTSCCGISCLIYTQ